MSTYTITTLPLIQKWCDKFLRQINSEVAEVISKNNSLYHLIVDYVLSRGASISEDNVVVPIESYGHISTINTFVLRASIRRMANKGNIDTSIDNMFSFVSTSVYDYCILHNFDRLTYPFSSNIYNDSGDFPELHHPDDVHGLYDYLFVVHPSDSKITINDIIHEGRQFSADLEKEDNLWFYQLYS